jgi:cold shock protein
MSEDITYTGKVVWFNIKLGYGFASWQIDGVQQREIFIHFSDIECEGFKTLLKDQSISFNIGLNKREQPKAIKVKVIA